MGRNIQIQNVRIYVWYKLEEGYKILKSFFSVIYFSALGYLVFFWKRAQSTGAPIVNLIPFKNILRDISRLNRFNAFSNLLGNILLFMPFSIILILLFKLYKLSSIILYGMLLSIAIEIAQFIFKVGVADIDDVILNTFSTFIGAYAYFIIRKIKSSGIPHFVPLGQWQLLKFAA